MLTLRFLELRTGKHNNRYRIFLSSPWEEMMLYKQLTAKTYGLSDFFLSSLRDTPEGFSCIREVSRYSCGLFMEHLTLAQDGLKTRE